MVLTIAEIVIVLATVPLLLMSVVLLIEVLAGTLLTSGSAGTQTPEDRLPVAVLIPAHNESETIGHTLSCISDQLRSEDRLLVVADNCSDDTVKVAREHGAEAIERSNVSETGKGYALSFGISHLKDAPKPVVIVIDADCAVGPDTINILSKAVSRLNRPVQSSNLVVVGQHASLLQRVGAFAFRIKNLVRNKGLRRLGLPCPLAGTGMAFPWSIIRDANLATGNIVEDMKLGIDLAIAGSPAVFEPRAAVTSHPPKAVTDQLSQRRRWEHGHLLTILQNVPRLTKEAIRQRRLDLLAMAADLFVIPLSLHAILSAFSLAASATILVLQGHPLPFILSATTILFVALAIAISWLSSGRDLLAAGEFAKIPVYVVAKIPVYVAFLFNREGKWKRSARANDREDSLN